MKVYRRRPLTGYLALVIGACAPSSDAGPAVTVQDSAGIRIVTTTALEWNEPLELRLPEPALTLPTPLSQTLLSSVLGAVELADQRIALLEGQSEQLLVYDQDGEEEFVFGGQGEGPGEFLQARSIQELSDGTLQVYDARLQRATRVTEDGQLAEVRGIPPGLPGRPADMWTLRDGSLLMWVTTPGGQDRERSAPEAHVYIYDGSLVRFSDGMIDTLATGPASTAIRQIQPQLIWSHPFSTSSTVSMSQGVSDVLFSTNRTHQIDVIPLESESDQTGLVFARFRYPGADGPIPQNELDGLREQTRENLAAEGAASTTALDFLFGRDFQPEIRPAFRKLLRGPDGSIWAQRYEPPQNEALLWWVVSEQGAFRGMVKLPERSDILSFSEHFMVLLRLSELDVPSIELVPLPVLDAP